MRVFVLRGGALGFAGEVVEEVVAEAGVFADAVLLGEADIEPHGAVEGAVLVEAEPGQVVVERFRAGVVGEIAVAFAEIGDGAGDAVDELADGGFASAFMRVGAVGEVAVEILRDGDLGGEGAPAARHFNIFLLEDNFAGIVVDFRGALVPFDVVEGRAGLGVEAGLEFEALGLAGARALGDRFGHTRGGGARGGRLAGFGTEG